MSEESKIDNTAGIVLEKKIGDSVSVGEIIAYVHANDEEKANSAVKNLADAYLYSKKEITVKSRVLEIYGI
jgi:pyrimidine-nucleoside phosphorylase